MARKPKDGPLVHLFPTKHPAPKHVTPEDLRAWRRVRRFLRTCPPRDQAALAIALVRAARLTRSLDRHAYALLAERIRGTDRILQMLDRAMQRLANQAPRSSRRPRSTLRVIRGGKPTAK